MVRNGVRGRKQLYKCKDCGRQFRGGRRRDKSQVITDYVEGKQTLKQLAVKYGVNERTIRRDLEGMRYVYKIARYKTVTIQMDTTYWGRGFGLMVIHIALHIVHPFGTSLPYICPLNIKLNNYGTLRFIAWRR